MPIGIKIVELSKKPLSIAYRKKKEYIISQDLKDQQLIKSQEKVRPSKFKGASSKALDP